jgi:hypothetical protein
MNLVAKWILRVRSGYNWPQVIQEEPRKVATGDENLPPVNNRSTFSKPRHNNTKFYTQTITVIGVVILKTIYTAALT